MKELEQYEKYGLDGSVIEQLITTSMGPTGVAQVSFLIPGNKALRVVFRRGKLERHDITPVDPSKIITDNN